MASFDESTWAAEISRRSMLRVGLAGGAALGAGGLLSACGGGSTPSADTVAADRTATKGGTLRVGGTGGGASDTLDVHIALSDPDLVRANQLFEPLTYLDSDFKVQMRLAESVEAEGSAATWTIRLKEGVEFHDGSPVTADDVIATFERILDPKNPRTGASFLGDIDLQRTKKLDARTVRVKLRVPHAEFPGDLHELVLGIVPRNFDPKRPVGTGPFKFESFTAGDRSVFARNENYHVAGEPKVDQLVVINLADDAARVNALLSNAVDVITNVPSAQRSTLEGNQDFAILRASCGNFLPIVMRVDAKPFDDVRVRQAIRLIADREQLVGQALSGLGRVGNDLYAPFDSAYAADLPQRKQDLEQAKSLLRQAGQEDLRVVLTTAKIYAGVVDSAQVFAEQARQAGVNVKVTEKDPSSFFSDGYLSYPFTQDFWYGQRSYLAQVAVATSRGARYNETHWDDPEFAKLIDQAKRELDESKRKELLHAAQTIEHDRGGYLIWGFNDQIDGHAKKVVGLKPSKTGVPLGNYDLRQVGFAS